MWVVSWRWLLSSGSSLIPRFVRTKASYRDVYHQKITRKHRVGIEKDVRRYALIWKSRDARNKPLLGDDRSSYYD